MADELAQQILEFFNNTTFPEENEIDDDKRKIYMLAHDILLTYRGHSDTLIRAFQVFMATNVRAYAYAGAARIMLMASYVSGGKYDEWGVKEGRKLFNIATELTPNEFEIEMIEPEIFNMLNQIQQMRKCIDALVQHPHAPTHFRYALVELWYWERKNNDQKIQEWSKRAQECATSDIQKLYALNKLAGIYLNQRRDKEAIELYQHVVKIDPNDPWAWHNMSIIYMDQTDYNKAIDCNRRALHIMDFGAAQHIQQQLMQRLNPQRHDDVIDEAPPYKIVAKSDKNKGGGFLKKLFGD